MQIRLLVLLAGVATLVTLALALVTGASAAPSGAGDPVKGKYIFAAAGGCGCHGANLAGFKASGPPFGEIFVGPFGSVAASNITSDKNTGVGGWTDAQLINAFRNGVDDEGHLLFPIMPYNTFHFMSDADAADLVAFLRTVPAVSNKTPERKLNGPVLPPPPLPPSPAAAPTGGVDRGRYLAGAISDCGGCHTPATPQGAPDMDKTLAGSAVPRAGGKFEIAPNVTPDLSTGIGYWTEQQIVTYLKQGIGPNGRTADGLMEEVVAGGFKGLGFNQLTDDDAAAMAAFLKSIPAVSNVPRAPTGPPAPMGPPGPPAPTPVPGPAVGGADAASAVPISGVMGGSLGGQSQWFRFDFDGSAGQGVVLNFAPATVEDPTVNVSVVGFRVWSNVCTATGCTFSNVGNGTRSGQPAGVKYWRTGGAARTYFIEVFNNSSQSIGYALALAGTTYPPSALPVPQP